jgi:hypothetical protein
MTVILCGGPHRGAGDGEGILKHARTPLVNQVGKDTLPQLLALLGRATVLLTPDSGPAHMATMVNTPVIGLYAATNPARSGPVPVAALVRGCLRCGGAEVFGQTGERAGLDHENRAARRNGPDRSRRGHRQADELLALSPLRGSHERHPGADLPGELLDKITILRIKAARMSDPAKVANVKHELSLLEKTWKDSGAAAVNLGTAEADLTRSTRNSGSSRTRSATRNAPSASGEKFIELARAVYFTNDERAAIKRRVNTLLGSTIVEEKSYKQY